MADYGKIEVTATLSEKSDYSRPYAKREFAAYEATTPTDGGVEKVTCDTGGTTYNTSKYSTLLSVTIKNLDSTNSVTAAFQNAAASAQSQVIATGKVAVFPDVLASANITLTASGAAVKVEIFVMGT